MKLIEARKARIGMVFHLGEITAPIRFVKKDEAGNYEIHIHAPDHVWFTYAPKEPFYVS